MSKDTLPVDFDERVHRIVPNAGTAGANAATEGSVVFSK
jgi:hypothetical protein